MREAAKSDDPSTQTGATLVDGQGSIISVGANTMPHGVHVTPERQERPLKYMVRDHAERNAIYAAARAKLGRATIDSIMVTIWAPCAECARGIIQAGCAACIQYPLDHSASDWGESQRVAYEMMQEAGVEVVEYDFPGVERVPLRRGGQLWVPERLPGTR